MVDLLEAGYTASHAIETLRTLMAWHHGDCQQRLQILNQALTRILFPQTGALLV